MCNLHFIFCHRIQICILNSLPLPLLGLIVFKVPPNIMKHSLQRVIRGKCSMLNKINVKTDFSETSEWEYFLSWS